MSNFTAIQGLCRLVATFEYYNICHSTLDYWPAHRLVKTNKLMESGISIPSKIMLKRFNIKQEDIMIYSYDRF